MTAAVGWILCTFFFAFSYFTSTHSFIVYMQLLVRQLFTPYTLLKPKSIQFNICSSAIHSSPVQGSAGSKSCTQSRMLVLCILNLNTSYLPVINDLNLYSLIKSGLKSLLNIMPLKRKAFIDAKNVCCLKQHFQYQTTCVSGLQYC